MNTCISFSTMHGKELLLGPLFQESFNANLVVPPGLNTDILGTFSREITREKDIMTVLRKKVEMGLQATGLSRGLASEGSFDSHPKFPWVNCNIETLLFVDKELGIEISAFELNTDSSARYGVFKSDAEIERFLNSINFGKQAIILRPHSEYLQPDYVFKGIQDMHTLKAAVSKIRSDFDSESIWIETDNRAHLSPKRQKTIVLAGHRLIEKLSSFCICCNAPGFWPCDVIKGLPCENCGTKTDWVLSEIYRCVNHACSFEFIKPRCDGLTHAPIVSCPICNP